MKQGWKICKLGEVGTVITGGTPSMKEETFYSSNDYCFFKPGDIAEGEISILKTAENFVSAKAYDKSRKLPKGSVLTTCIGIIGKVGITEVDSICNQQINAIIPNEKSFSRYIAYTIISQKDKMKNKANAAVVPILNKSQFSEISIPLPPLPVQQQIVSELDLLTSIINKKKAQLDELDKLAQATFYDMFGDPVENEKGWEVKSVIEHCKCIVPGRDKPKSFSGGTPWVTTNEIINLGITKESAIGLSDAEIVEVKAKVIPQGSVIMTCVGDLGVTTIAGVDMVVNQQLHAFICDDSLINTFLMYNLSYRKDYMLKMASNTTVLYMNKTTCNSIPILLPPLPLQQQFAQKIELIESQKSKIKASLAELETLLAATMDKYFG